MIFSRDMQFLSLVLGSGFDKQTFYYESYKEWCHAIRKCINISHKQCWNDHFAIIPIPKDPSLTYFILLYWKKIHTLTLLRSSLIHTKNKRFKLKYGTTSLSCAKVKQNSLNACASSHRVCVTHVCVSSWWLRVRELAQFVTTAILSEGHCHSTPTSQH